MLQTSPLPSSLPDVSAEIKTAISAEIKQFPVHTNYASLLGHPCARRLVYNRLDWDKLPPIPVERKMIFEGGKVIEQHIAKVYLEKAGFKIVESDRPANWPEKQIGGRLDFVIKRHDLPHEIPVEVKSMEHFAWKKIESVEDLLLSKKVWHRQYPAQLMLYMLYRGVELGMFLNISKLTFEPRHIWVNLDYTYAEELIKKAEFINKQVSEKTYPDRIEFDHNICGKCDFIGECLPDIANRPASFVDDQELTDNLARYMEIRSASNEAAKLRKIINLRLEGIEKAIIGTRFVCEWVPSNRESFDLPLEVENQIGSLMAPYAKKGKILKIRDLNKATDDENQ